MFLNIFEDCLMQLWNSVQKGKIWAFFSNKKEWKKIFFIEIKGT